MKWSSIINQLKKGNNEVLGSFYKDYGEYCIAKLTRDNQCSRDEGNDIFIEAVMNLREKLLSGKLESIANTRAYLYKTCHYMFLNRLEQNARRNKVLNDAERFYYDSIYYSDEKDTIYNPELMTITRQAWDFLSERCKDILNYFYIDKLDMQEIAGLMGLSNANVAKTTKSRCYKKFMEKGHELKNEQEEKVEH